MTVRVGIVGVGVMGADHARKLNGCVAGAEVTAVADYDPRSQPPSPARCAVPPSAPTASH